MHQRNHASCPLIFLQLQSWPHEPSLLHPHAAAVPSPRQRPSSPRTPASFTPSALNPSSSCCSVSDHSARPAFPHLHQTLARPCLRCPAPMSAASLRARLHPAFDLPSIRRHGRPYHAGRASPSRRHLHKAAACPNLLLPLRKVTPSTPRSGPSFKARPFPDRQPPPCTKLETRRMPDPRHPSPQGPRPCYTPFNISRML